MSLGLHLSKQTTIFDEKKHKSILDSIRKNSERFNLSAIALFILGPLNKNKIAMDYQTIKKYCEDNSIVIWPHATYIAAGVWSITRENRHINKSLMWIRHVKDHLVIGKQLGAKGVIFHLPKQELKSIIETMEILSDCKVINSVRRNEGILPKISLETPASKPGTDLTYDTPEKLNTLVKTLSENKKITLEWDIVIDSAHQYAYGINFATDWTKWESELSDETRSRIALIHLNGADGKNFGTGKDGHRIPLSREDSIWGNLISDEFRDYLNRTTDKELSTKNLYNELSDSEKTIIKNSSLNNIVQWCKKNNVTMICEVDVKNYKEAKFALDVINGLLGKTGGSSLVKSLLNDLVIS